MRLFEVQGALKMGFHSAVVARFRRWTRLSIVRNGLPNGGLHLPLTPACTGGVRAGWIPAHTEAGGRGLRSNVRPRGALPHHAGVPRLPVRGDRRGLMHPGCQGRGAYVGGAVQKTS